MRGLTASDLLDIADAAGGRDWVSRGLLLASYAWPGSSEEERLCLPIGIRDRLILALRVATFGRTIAARSRCTVCGAEWEFAVDAGAILESHSADAPSSVMVDADGAPRQVRLPSSQDLAATATLDPGDAEWALLERCVEEGAPARSESFRKAAAEALAAADPMAHIELEIECAQCGSATSAVLDIVSLLLSEITSGARRAAWEVHALAAAYGWTEQEILAMTTARRRRYLAMVSV